MSNVVCKDTKVLIVEDSLITQELLIEYCNLLGCKYKCVENGLEAVNLLKTEKFDICFMDLDMPIMDGFEATRIIRQTITNHLPIVALTANNQQDRYKLCFSVGMNNYCSKPVKKIEFEKIIKQHVHNSKVYVGLIVASNDFELYLVNPTKNQYDKVRVSKKKYFNDESDKQFDMVEFDDFSVNSSLKIEQSTVTLNDKMVKFYIDIEINQVTEYLEFSINTSSDVWWQVAMENVSLTEIGKMGKKIELVNRFNQNKL